MITTADFRKGLILEYENKLYMIVDFQHHKPGKGGAIMRVKFKDIKTGQVLDKTFRSGTSFNQVFIEKVKMQYLYKEGEKYYFMDTNSYDQIYLTEEQLGGKSAFLKEGEEIAVLNYHHNIIGIELPDFIILKVEYTEPGMKGDTVTNVFKPAKLENGLEVKVPLFVNIGDTIKVDTRTGEYVERV